MIVLDEVVVAPVAQLDAPSHKPVVRNGGVADYVVAAAANEHNPCLGIVFHVVVGDIIVGLGSLQLDAIAPVRIHRIAADSVVVTVHSEEAIYRIA